MAKKEYIVKHKNLNLAVGGKVQKIPFDTKLTIDSERAKGMLKKGWLVDPRNAKSVTVDDQKDSDNS